MNSILEQIYDNTEELSYIAINEDLTLYYWGTTYEWDEIINERYKLLELCSPEGPRIKL